MDVKKAIICVLIFVMLASLNGAAVADGEFATFEALYGSWRVKEQVGPDVVLGEYVYPEGVSGVWSTDGSMENFSVGITDDERGEKAREDILAAVRNDGGITFVTQKYDYSELNAAKENIGDYVASGDSAETGAAGWGIYFRDNKVHVDIVVSAPGAAEFMRWGYENFGDMILFESVDGYPVPAAEEFLGGGADYGGVIAAAAAIVFILGTVIILRRKLFGVGREAKKKKSA